VRTRGRTRLVFVQHVPYVKTMLGGVIFLKLACSQAVQNQERCIELAECAPCLPFKYALARGQIHSLQHALLRCACPSVCWDAGSLLRVALWLFVLDRVALVCVVTALRLQLAGQALCGTQPGHQGARAARWVCSLHNLHRRLDPIGALRCNVLHSD
jgi:hypothetical protein